MGPRKIAEHFARNYKSLFNNVTNGHKLDYIRDNISRGAASDCQSLVSKIDSKLIDTALKKMKSGKRDAIFDVTSDCYLNGPVSLKLHLANLIKIFISHGSVPHCVLLCTLIPLVKNSLGDITSSNNYRAIAGGCLLLKLLDIVILLLEGDKLKFSELQFAYQSMTSTVTCSWTASAVIDYFNRNGSSVFAAAMDMSKAFDMVEWTSLFSTLIKRKVSFCILRLMLFIYENQRCNVKWSGELSSCFYVSNGVRQGAVSSAILFGVYIDELLEILQRSRIGCYMDGIFFGAVIFADDILLLSATRDGLQSLVKMFQKFASQKNLKFGTDTNPLRSKTKCIVFTKKRIDYANLAPIVLDGKDLPWVKKVNHLGCILETNNSMKLDMLSKRGQFISKVNSLLQEFHFVDPKIMIKFICTYATNFYGSSLWNLYSRDCEKLYSSWNVAVRNALKLDRRTHRHLVAPLSGQPHLKNMLLSRFAKFHKSLLNSPKFSVRFLARLLEGDQRTVFGRMLDRLKIECNTADIHDLNTKQVKDKVVFVSPLENGESVGALACELLELRD